MLSARYCLVLGLLVTMTCYLQRSDAQFLFREGSIRVLHNEAPPAAEIFNLNEGFSEPLFFPADLREFIGLNSMKDHLIKNRNGLFYIPDGTDRVYQLTFQNERPVFTRKDHSFFSGHTFHALNFTYKDSIYSFSGFGFGHNNSQLRVFIPATGNWKSIKLDQDVAVNFRSHPGVWVNSASGTLWAISHILTDQAQNFSALNENNCDSIPVRSLDVLSGKWRTAGTLNPNLLQTLKTVVRIGSCPWGELVLDSTQAQVSLIDYNENRLLNLNAVKNRQIADELIRIKRKHNRLYTWFSEGNFMLVAENGNLNSYPLQLSDFSKSGMRIFNTLPDEWLVRDPMILSGLVFISGLVFFFLGFVLPMFRKPLSTRNISVTLELIFNEVELQILRTLSDNPGHELNTEQVNQILGTSKKTIEVQKKQRSDVIKSINEKYKRLMDDLEPLIVQDRLEDDRRQVRYLLNLEKYATLLGRIVG